MKVRMLTAAAAVSLVVLLGACSSSSDTSKTNTDGSKQDAKSSKKGGTSSGDDEACPAILTFTNTLRTLHGNPNAPSVNNRIFDSESIDSFFDPVEVVLGDLPTEFQAVFPTLEDAVLAATGPDITDDEILAVWAEPKYKGALDTAVGTTRSVCGLPADWMTDDFPDSVSN